MEQQENQNTLQEQEQPQNKVKETMSNLRKIGVVSFAKLYAIFGLLTGLFMGIIFLVMYLILNSNPLAQETGQSNIFGSFGILGVLIIPLIYGFFGFIAGLLGGVFINLALKITGGLKVKVEN